MGTITAVSSMAVPEHLRPLNVLHDLPGVADLVEKCFADTLDQDGRRYLQQMRRAGQDNAFMRWASNAVESVSMPLSGYVWEENNEIIGNVSTIPYRRGKKKIYLIANVATHPDYRRRGIGRALTEAAMRHASQRHAYATWLHVRADNPGAIALYASLGFRELARRTAWQAKSDQVVPSLDDPAITIGNRSSREWEQQHEAWLESLYPELMAWYQPMPWRALRPGLRPWLYRFVMDYDVRHWTARTNGALSAILSWQAFPEKNDRLWAAVPSQGSDKALTTLLLHARRSLPWRRALNLDFPAGEYDASIEAAGFHALRTLLWMKLDEEIFVDRS
jgi:GNAT superfamily N-acetyltransferase